MSRNHLNIRRQLRNHLVHSINHAINAATALNINKGKPVSNEVVSHVHNIRVGKENDRVTVGVSGREVESADIFPVQVYGDIMIEGDDSHGQTF